MADLSLSERAAIHADKMDGEGWYVTANVLSSCARALDVDEHVNAFVRAERLERALRGLVEECVNPAGDDAFEAGEWPALDAARKVISDIDECSSSREDDDECGCGEDTCVCLHPTA